MATPTRIQSAMQSPYSLRAISNFGTAYWYLLTLCVLSFAR